MPKLLPALSFKTNKKIFFLSVLLLPLYSYANHELYPKWFGISSCGENSVRVVPILDKNKKDTLDNAQKNILTTHFDPHQKTQDFLYKEKLDGSWWIARKDWNTITKQSPKITELDNSKKLWIKIDVQNNLRYRLDLCSSEIYIQVGAEAVTDVDLTQGKILPVTKAPLGGFLNFNGNYGGFSGSGHGSVDLELSIFKDYNSFQDGLLLGTGTPKRLNTYLTFDTPSKAQELIIGDTITKDPDFESSSRFAGLQYGTNYALQPQRITFPLPVFSGSSALPSTADIFLNGQKLSEQSVPNGSYKIVGLPTLSGAGDLTIILRDPLGNEQTVSIPFYATTTLLAEGLNNNTYQIGTLRENYGLDNDQYDHIFASSTIFHGFNNVFTGGFHIEGSDFERMLSTTEIYQYKNFGVLSSSLAVSQSSKSAAGINTFQYLNGVPSTSDGGIGWLGSLAFERDTRSLSYGIIQRFASAKYADLGRPIGSLQTQQNAHISYNSPQLGSFSLLYSWQKTWQTQSNSFTGLGYNISLNRWANLQASYIKSVSGPSNQTLFLSATILFGNSTSASVGWQNNAGQTSERYQLQKAPLGPLGWGYNAVIDTTPPGEKQVDVNYTGTRGTIGGGFAGTTGNVQPSLEAKSALAFMDNAIFWTRPVDNSFTVVDTLIPHIHVLQDNLDVGQTGSNGKLLVPNLRPFQENKIAIAIEDLPIYSQLADSERIVVPPAFAGVNTKFDIDSNQTVTLKVKRDNGEFIPVSSTIFIDKSKIKLLSGFNGLVYFEAKDGVHYLQAFWNGGGCSTKFTVINGIGKIKTCTKY